MRSTKYLRPKVFPPPELNSSIEPARGRVVERAAGLASAAALLFIVHADPTNGELGEQLDTLSRRVVRLLERRGFPNANAECPTLDFEAGSSPDQLQTASVNYRIAVGPHAGYKALTLYSLPPLDEAPSKPLLARLAGPSLHAATVCEAHQRRRLEQMCGYITRPPIAPKRLSVDARGGVVYRYKQPFRDGSTDVLLAIFLFRSWPIAVVTAPSL